MLLISYVAVVRRSMISYYTVVLADIVFSEFFSFGLKGVEKENVYTFVLVVL